MAHKHGPPPTCGEEMLGTYPNCYPAPSTNENHDPNADKDDDSCGGSGSGSGSGSGDGSGGDGSGDGSDGGTGSSGSGTGGDGSGDGSDGGTGSSGSGTGDGGSQKGTRQNRGTTTTTTTSTDPCKTWASNTRDALNTANPDGTYNIAPAPSGCGTSNQEILGYIKVLGDDAAREIRDILEDWRQSTQGVAELNEADREAAIDEYKKAWNELPKPVRVAGEVTATYAGCAVLAGAAYAAVFRGKPAAGAKIAQHAAGLGCNIGFELIPLIDDSDPDGDNSDDDGSGDGSGADPEPTPDPDDPDGDYDGNGKTELDELGMADQKLWDGEITAEEFMRIWRKYACDQGDTHECGK